MKGHYVLVGGGLVELEVPRLGSQAVFGRMEVKPTRPELRSGLLAALEVVKSRQVALRVELGRTVLQSLLERQLLLLLSSGGLLGLPPSDCVFDIFLGHEAVEYQVLLFKGWAVFPF